MKNKTIQQLSIQAQIIDFVDQNDGATFGQISKQFDGKEYDLQVYLNAFGELLADGQLRQVVADKNLGTYKYHLPA